MWVTLSRRHFQNYFRAWASMQLLLPTNFYWSPLTRHKVREDAGVDGKTGIKDAIQQNDFVPQSDDVGLKDGEVEVEGKTGISEVAEQADDGSVDRPSSPPKERSAPKVESFMYQHVAPS